MPVNDPLRVQRGVVLDEASHFRRPPVYRGGGGGVVKRTDCLVEAGGSQGPPEPAKGWPAGHHENCPG